MVELALRDRVVGYSQDEGLFRKGDKVVVAVSGGKDSVSLLHVLNESRHELGLSLVVAHYNHALRKSADRDQRFVQKLSAQMGLPFISAKSRSKLPQNVSVEEYAREIRYAFLRQTVRDSNASSVAIAHTRDDLAETVLMRILRGTGLGGVRAMLPRRQINDVMVVRPLLFLTRAEVEQYVLDHQLKFVVDPTNRSLKFLRNRIRMRILPFLEKNLGRDVKASLASLAAVSSVDYDFLDQEARRQYKNIVRRTPSTISLLLGCLRSLHPSLQRAVIRLAIAELKGDLKAISLENVVAVEGLVRTEKKKTVLHLPKGIIVTKLGEKAVFKIADF